MQVLFQFDLRSDAAAAALGAVGAADDAEHGSRSGVRAVVREEIAACISDLLNEGGGDTDADGEERRRPNQGADHEVAEFARRLIEGTLEHRASIDERLQSVTRNWDLRRMANVDRNVLRIAVYELMFCSDVPPKVAINEAIEIGKKFSTANSGGFVNGILDRIRIDLDRERVRRPADPVPPSDGEATG